MFFAYYLGLDLNLLDKTYISGKSGGVSIMEEDSEGNHKLIKLNKINCQGEVLGNCNTIVLNMIHFILI